MIIKKLTNTSLQQSLAVMLVISGNNNIALVMFVMSNVGLVVSVEFDSSGNDWKLDELALYKAF